MGVNSRRTSRRWWFAILCAPALSLAADGAAPETGPNLGPYNATFLEGGIGIDRPLAAGSELVAAAASWSITGWISTVRREPGVVIVAAVGDCAGGAGAAGWRGVYLADGELRASLGSGVTLRSATQLQPGRWYAIAATYDGAMARLYVDGEERAAARVGTRAVAPRLELAPVAPQDSAAASPHFGGSLAQFTLTPVAQTPQQIGSLAHAEPQFDLITFTAVGSGWPWQEHAWRGLKEPQDPWTLPHANTAPSAPVAVAAEPAPRELEAQSDGTAIIRNWQLAPAPRISAAGDELSQPRYQDRDWYAAVVPGTVLSTLIARGVYPDPDYGLNNLAIPDTLSRQDYWYRSVFSAPDDYRGRDLTLIFQGINYAAEIWLNGRRLGEMRGAFTRGRFDVTGLVRAGELNAIAVRVSPPPHPGIPHEQSISAGPGNNGGALAIDGPTLHPRDPHGLTPQPQPRTESADGSTGVSVENRRATPVSGTVVASFDGIRVEKPAVLPPGVTEVTLDAAEFKQLHLTAPRLWWPNGYGAANLHDLHIEVRSGGAVSDSASMRFGIRELTYELSLFDREGRLRRVEVDPAQGTLLGERLIDVRHEAIKRTPQGWAESLTGAGETSPAVRPAGSEALRPYLVIRVNGVPIAARGGSWGMDDSRKRSSRERLEPYFQLHRDAHLNIIRNWLGQNTEEVFYELADEYGLLVLNDFWVSTQDFQMEPQDPALFLANARDVISRYRNHPSIAVWFGRNEGVPQPILNEGLADLVATLDGTRYYTGSSNAVNLQGSGPYNYRPPEQYFTQLARGFSVEVGTPSLATLESLQASIPAADRWPLSDTYAYHDWHFGGNGDVATFMAALAQQYGPGTSLADFERKAQLMNYVSYRAIFEGFAAHLWTQNSGRLLWMTHPSWPSNTWQIYSADYDTGAAYYAVKKACEPVHVQLNLPDFAVAVVNTTQLDQRHLRLRSRVLSLDNRLLGDRVERVDARANATTTLAPLADLSRALPRERLVLVKLTLTDQRGVLLSDNTYWQAAASADQQRLNDLEAQPVDVTAHSHESPSGTVVTVRLVNSGRAAALNAKITMLDPAGGRVLPVYYGDNYVALLPGEARELEVRCPSGAPPCARVALRGWNIVPKEAVISR
ncbi:MAG: LamG-like jellyroll fold domain-containing protein [Steroidobacteraceae bacterium]